jgi:hypothetical protein
MRGCRLSVIARFVLLVALLGLCPNSPREVTISTPDDTTAASGEVRLRKLHLVRPDLIPYPISFEVYA